MLHLFYVAIPSAYASGSVSFISRYAVVEMCAVSLDLSTMYVVFPVRHRLVCNSSCAIFCIL